MALTRVDSSLISYPTLAGETGVTDNSYQTTPIVDIKRFGLTGDGVADDKTKLDNAIASTPIGGILVLEPTKTYLITTVTIAKKMTIIAHGATLKATALSAVSITCTEDVFFEGGTYDNVELAWSTTNVTSGGVSRGAVINEA